MCTLYVLDWYHRTYVYTAESFPRNYPIPVDEGEIGHIMTEINMKDWKPPSQTSVDPLLGTCSAGGCALYCCSAQRLFNSTDEPTSMLASLAKPQKSPLEIRPDSNDNNQQNALKPFESGVAIKLIELNVTIDNRYCIEKSCVPKKGRYNLYVPISAYMPTIPFRLRIR